MLGKKPLNPQLCIYRKDIWIDRPCNFSILEMTVHFASPHDDPFQDPVSNLLIRKECKLEANSRWASLTRAELVAFASAQMATQFRVFRFSVVVFAQWARFLRWDRAGVVVSKAFDFTRHPDWLAEFFWRYSHMLPTDRGEDLSVIYKVIEKEGIHPETKRPTIFTALLCKIYVPDDVEDAKVTQSVLDAPSNSLTPEENLSSESNDGHCLAPPLEYTPQPLLGRCTRKLSAMYLKINSVRLLKDTWRVDEEGEVKEGDILRGIDELGVIKLIRAGDVLDHRTITQSLANEPWACKVKDGGLVAHRHYRLLLE